MLTKLISISILLLGAVWAQPASFVTCIGPAGTGAVCNLPAGFYGVTSTLVVGRSGITIRGLGATPEDTVLQRYYATMYSLLRVPAGMTVTIENIKFDGNRANFNSNCPPANIALLDVEVLGTATINNATFIYAPGHSLSLHGGSLNNSTVSQARSTGVLLYGSASAYGNSFITNGTAAINVQETGGSRISGNLLYLNRYEMSDGAGGGQLYLETTSGNVIVDENVINGENWVTGSSPINGCSPPATPQKVTGVEAYGYGHKFYNNEVVKNSDVGMSFNGTSGVTVAGPDPYCPSCGARYVELNGAFGIWFFASSFGASTGVTLNHVRSVNNGYDGVNLDNTSGTGFTNLACLSATSPYNPYWISGGSLTYPYPGAPGTVNYSSCP